MAKESRRAPLSWPAAVGLWIAYLALVALTRDTGQALAPLAAIPLIASGILLGRRWGTALTAAATAVNYALHLSFGAGDTMAGDLAGTASNSAIGLALAWGAGFMTELVGRERRASAALKAEIARRARAEGDRDRATIRWESLLRNSPDYVALLDPDRRLLYVNRLPAGMAMAEVQGRFLAEFMPDPAAVARIEGLIEQAFRERHAVSISTPGVGPNRTPAWFEAQLTPLVNPDGTIEGALFMGRDATAEHSASEKVREAEARFQQLTETIEEVFWMTDPSKDQMLYISPGFEKIWGIPCERLLAEPRLWLESIHPDDRERVLRAATEKQAAGTYDEEYRIVLADGAQRWIHDRAFPVREADGTVRRIVGVAQDVTARRQAEEDLRSRESLLQETQAVAQLGSWEVDLVTGLQHGSPENRRLYGMAPEEAYVPENIVRHMPPADRAAVAAALQETVAKGRFQLDHRILREDGSIRWLRTTAEVRRDAAGTPVRVVGLSQDITESVRAQETIVARGALLEETQAAAHVGSWEIDLVHPRYTSSPETRRLYGLDPAQGEQDPAELRACLHPDDAPTVDLAVAATIRDGQATIEQRVLRPDGSIRWLRSHGVLVRDAQGRPARILGISQDVTEARRQTEALRVAKERFELASQATRDVLWDLDLAADRAWYSPTFTAQFGGDPPPESGSMATLMERIHPEDLERLGGQMAQVLTGAHATMESEYRFRRADGTWANVLDRAFIVRDAAGRPVRLVGAMQDITERVQAQRKVEEGERRLKDLMDNVDEVFISDSLDGRPPLVSPAIQGLFGRPAQDFVDNPVLWLSMLHPEDAPQVLANHGRLLAGEPTRDEARVVHADGTVRWMVATMHPTKDAAGKVVRLDGTLRDITAEKASAEQEAKVREMTEQAAFRVRFLNTAAHELSTPLTPIKLQLASLRKGTLGPLTPRQADAMGLLDRNLNRLGLLVKDLLDATRLQGGQLRLQRLPLDLAAITLDAVRSFAEKAAGDGVELRAVAAPGLPILGDEARLTQVLFNLVANALKYTPPGGSVVVRAAAVGGEAQVEVQDSGVGLRPEQAARLFHPFEQVLDPGQQKSGTGLGLYISKGIVEQHGGALTGHSAGPGQGSTFTLRLPLAMAAVPSPEQPAALAPPA
jgi:PAS domain S-box-containing protein